MTGSLEYYKVFYYTAKYKSLTAAAKALSVSQPAVSQTLRQLEQDVGAKLFSRASKGVKLTREGEILYGYVAKGYEQIELGEEMLFRMRNLELGEMRIGASDMTLRFFLLPYLEAFHERFPDIKVSVTNGPTPETLTLLQEERIDFGAVSTPFDETAQVNAAPVKEIEDIFVAGRKFIPYKNRTLDLQELSSLPLIFLEGRTSTRTYMDEFLSRSGVCVNPEFELATSDMIVQFALRSLGIGCVMREFAQEHIDSGRLFELRFNKMIPKRRICIVTDQKKSLSAAAARLLEMIEKDRKP